MVMGDRLVKYHRTAKFVDEKNKLKCVVKFSSAKKNGIFGKK